VISGNPVFISQWDDRIPNGMAHIELSRKADAIVIAPASADLMAKHSLGLADDLLSTLLIARGFEEQGSILPCPLLMVPAMNLQMWQHVATQRSVARLKADGVIILGPASGPQACGEVGAGRMLEPEEILEGLCAFFQPKTLLGKQVVVTAGPTYEAIDPVRFIGNHSSGKMGYALAAIFYEKGADVTLVSGPSPITPAYSGIQLQKITSAQEMFSVVMENAKDAAIIIMSAAVSDYTPSTVFENKLKKQHEELDLKLMKTKDILHHLGAQKKPGQFIAGFALETNDEFANAQQKLLKKNADCIILNSLRDAGAGFGADTNTITIIDHNGHQIFPNKSKKEVAADIYNYIRQQIN
jgi:phosphopantothenoylcysteine decarboxylase/phosphopantothenate--cysteine ligase